MSFVFSVQITPSLCVPRKSGETPGCDLHNFCQKAIFCYFKQSLQSEDHTRRTSDTPGLKPVSSLRITDFTKTDITRKK